jgi:2-polyprenyl-3-methyl-5-hydroxy-6-metoxy-1,4-benzoquinol methylase
VAKAELLELLDGEPSAELMAALECGDAFPYTVSTFLRRDPVPNYADAALALLEQRSCGIFIGDLTPECLRFNADTGVVSLLGYHRAVRLDAQTQALRGRAYLEWCRDQEFARLGVGGKAVQHFLLGSPQTTDQHEFWHAFTDGRLQLAVTQSIGKQKVTGHASGISHTVDTPDCVASGDRAFTTERIAALEAAFAGGGDDAQPAGAAAAAAPERVLDVGCAGGVVAEWLARRGCAVTAIDVDEQLLAGCAVLANIHCPGAQLHYQKANFEYEAPEGPFDTVCLFSVLPWFQDRAAAARRAGDLAQRRILLEVRLKEYGWRRRLHGFEQLAGWELPDWEALCCEMEVLFGGFRYFCDHGPTDGAARLIELRRVEAVAK